MKRFFLIFALLATLILAACDGVDEMTTDMDTTERTTTDTTEDLTTTDNLPDTTTT